MSRTRRVGVKTKKKPEQNARGELNENKVAYDLCLIITGLDR
jgi:hypothetical protein